MMIILIDNYDSFSYNLYQLVGEINPDIKVIRNDAMSAEELIAMNPEKIIISPGPGRPENAGICVELIRKLRGDIPLLGVCLGHQAICVAYGGEVGYAKKLMHGKQSETNFELSSKLFTNCPETDKVARYHSLALDEATMPKELKVIARSDDNEVMAVEHESLPVYGLQFHPESIMTPIGKKIIKNFLDM